MAKLGEDIIGTSGLPPFFAVAGTPQAPPENRLGEAVRTSEAVLNDRIRFTVPSADPFWVVVTSILSTGSRDVEANLVFEPQ